MPKREKIFGRYVMIWIKLVFEMKTYLKKWIFLEQYNLSRPFLQNKKMLI